MKRIYLVLFVLVMASFFLGPSYVSASDSKAPIKIGVMWPMSGPLGMAGEMAYEATKFAFEMAGYQVAGRKIVTILEDSGGKPAIAVDKARKLVEKDKVAVVIGPLIGSTVLATGSYLAKAGIPHLLTSPCPVPAFKNKWSFALGGSEPQHTTCMGAYTYDVLGYKSIDVMTGDTIQGRGFLGSFMRAFKKRGGKVLQEQYAPHPCNDYAPYLTALKDANALVAWYDGADGIRFLTQLHEYGVRKRMPFVAAFHGSFFAPYILNRLPKQAANAVIGEYCVTRYTDLLDTNVNKQYVAAFRRKYGVKRGPFELENEPYEAVLIALEALKATKGNTSPNKLREAILGLKLDLPSGRLKIDPKTRCIIHDMYIFKVGKRDGHFVWVPVYTYKDVPPFGL